VETETEIAAREEALRRGLGQQLSEYVRFWRAGAFAGPCVRSSVVDAETRHEQRYLFKVTVGTDRSAALSVLTLDETGERATDHRLLGVDRDGKVSAIETGEVDPEEAPPLAELARIAAATDPNNETAEVVPIETYMRIKKAHRETRPS
jgi:hypothetical protein